MAKKTAPVVESTSNGTMTPFDADRARIDKITRRLMGDKETKSSTLPYAEEAVGNLIDAANQLWMEIAEKEKELKTLKDHLIAEVVGLEVPGLRSESACIIVNVRSRTTLNKDKLLTKIPAAELAACYEDGAEYYEARIAEVK